MANLWKCVLTGYMLNQKMQNVLHFSDQGTAVTEQEMSLLMENSFIGIIRNLQNNGFRWRQIAVSYNGGSGFSVPSIRDVDIPGVLSGASAHPSICGLFSLRTSVPGRHGRGRFYMPGVHNESVANGVHEPFSFTGYVSRAGDLRNVFAVGGSSNIRMVVQNRLSNAPGPLVTNIIARNEWGIQRRRNIGVGS